MNLYDLDSCLDEIVRENEDFLHRRCHIFAIALHHLTELPLAGVLDFDVERTATSLIHAFVIVNDELILDISGVRSYESMLKDFMCWDPEFSFFKEKELLVWGEGKSYLDGEACMIVERAQIVAKEVLAITKQMASLQLTDNTLSLKCNILLKEVTSPRQMSLF